MTDLKVIAISNTEHVSISIIPSDEVKQNNSNSSSGGITTNNNSELYADIVFVLDTSGSMGNDATVVTSDGKTVNDVTNLQLAAQATRMQIRALNSNSRAAIVTFNSVATT